MGRVYLHTLDPPIAVASTVGAYILKGEGRGGGRGGKRSKEGESGYIWKDWMSLQRDDKEKERIKR